MINEGSFTVGQACAGVLDVMPQATQATGLPAQSALFIHEIHEVVHLHTAVIAPGELQRAYAVIACKGTRHRGAAVGVGKARRAACNRPRAGAGSRVCG